MPGNPRVLSRSTRLPNEQKGMATASCHPIHDERQIANALTESDE